MVGRWGFLRAAPDLLRSQHSSRHLPVVKPNMDAPAILGLVFSGFLTILLLLLFVITNYNWRSYDTTFGIDPKHAAETAPLAAIIDWCSLPMAAFVLRGIVKRDTSALLTYSIALVQISLFVITSTKILRKITVSLLLPSLPSTISFCVSLFQHSDFDMISNSLYNFLMLVCGIGAFVALVALHWKTREKLIVKVSKAEKQIKVAKKWFWFDSGDTV